jgi:hypothetical protein
MDVKYDHLEIIDVPAIVAENKEKGFSQTLTVVMVETRTIDPLGN